MERCEQVGSEEPVVDGYAYSDSEGQTGLHQCPIPPSTFSKVGAVM
jgi:hypothetical protein